MFRFIFSLPQKSIIACIKFYQKTIRHTFKHSCAFNPSCSSYFIGCVERFGAVTGSFLGIKRLFRCTPKNKGKIDEVPQSLKGDYKWLI